MYNKFGIQEDQSLKYLDTKCDKHSIQNGRVALIYKQMLIQIFLAHSVWFSQIISHIVHLCKLMKMSVYTF